MLRVVRIMDLRESVFNPFIKCCVTLNTPQLSVMPIESTNNYLRREK